MVRAHMAHATVAPLLLLLLLSPLAIAPRVADTRPDVGAIYFGDWSPDPWMEVVHG